MSPGTVSAVIYINAFIVGAALMGFEMLGSRYLFPYFGGGIALTVGYLAGGSLVDRNPSSSVIAIAVAAAGVYLAVIPPIADPVIGWILDTMGDGPVAILCASAVLCLVPLTLLGMYSPVAVRLIVRSTDEVGRVAGLVYGISTFGNVFGILFTTFYLIPEMGSRSITYLFGGVLLASAAMLYAVRRR